MTSCRGMDSGKGKNADVEAPKTNNSKKPLST